MYAIAIAIVFFAGRPLLRNRSPTRTAFTARLMRRSRTGIRARPMAIQHFAIDGTVTKARALLKMIAGEN